MKSYPNFLIILFTVGILSCNSNKYIKTKKKSQDCLKHIVHDSDNIEKLLKKYAIRSIFLTDISDDQIHRLNKSLGIQWAIDIYNRLN